MTNVRGLLTTAERPLQPLKRGFHGAVVHQSRRGCRKTISIQITGSRGKSTATVLIGRLLAILAPNQTHLAERVKKLAQDGSLDRLFAIGAPDHVADIIARDAFNDEIIYVKGGAADQLQDCFPRLA